MRRVLLTKQINEGYSKKGHSHNRLLNFVFGKVIIDRCEAFRFDHKQIEGDRREFNVVHRFPFLVSGVFFFLGMFYECSTSKLTLHIVGWQT